ncbi:MAG: lipoyl(octanoyl) transferase LipB, partial [Pseudomonadota bacterium]|nr:lipoyl(octanoyl) transferase LipB [Pseudomonadota bacterium]
RHLGMRPYAETVERMQAFTESRDVTIHDEIWLLQHPPVFTQGLAGKAEHVLAPGNIPVVQTDRGGQVTYHGPGQLVVYFLIDLRRMDIGIRTLVSRLELSVIATLAEYGISAATRADAPGVYVDDAKICSIGLRVRRGCTYHGIAFNIAMDLEPFARINPCGFRNLKIIQLADFVPEITIPTISLRLIPHLSEKFGYTVASQVTEEE